MARGRVEIQDFTPRWQGNDPNVIEEGELFGELAAIDGDARQEYAVAVEDSRALINPCDDIMWLMTSRPDVALSVTKLIGMRRRRIENRLRNVLFLSGHDRVLRVLVEPDAACAGRAALVGADGGGSQLSPQGLHQWPDGLKQHAGFMTASLLG